MYVPAGAASDTRLFTASVTADGPVRLFPEESTARAPYARHWRIGHDPILRRAARRAAVTLRSSSWPCRCSPSRRPPRPRSTAAWPTRRAASCPASRSRCATTPPATPGPPSPTRGPLRAPAAAAGHLRADRWSCRLRHERQQPACSTSAPCCTINPTLQVGGVQETVTVTVALAAGRDVGDDPHDDASDSATPSRTCRSTAAASRTSSRCTPTVQVDTSRGQLSFAGQRGINANVNVDGADYNQPFFGGIRGGERSEQRRSPCRRKPIQEFQVVAAGYSAEFGRSTAAWSTRSPSRARTRSRARPST